MTDPDDRQLRALMARLHEMTPLPPTFDELALVRSRRLGPTRSRRQRRATWAIAAVAVAAVGVGVFVASRGDDRSMVTSQTTSPPDAVSSHTTVTGLTSLDVAGLWVFPRRSVPTSDGNRVGTGVPLPSPLPAYRYEPDGTVHGFDGCNQTSQGWELVNGQLQAPPAPKNTKVSTAALCLDSTGNAPITVPAVPNTLSVLGGVPTLSHSNPDGSTAHGIRVDDLPSPSTLAGTSWVLAVDGDDLTISFRDDGTVELTTDVASCSTGRYDYIDRLVELELSEPDPGCGDHQLGVLTSGPLLVTSPSDLYTAGSLLLASERGAVRLFPSGTTSTHAEGG
jgi:hypothetical protein